MNLSNIAFPLWSMMAVLCLIQIGCGDSEGPQAPEIGDAIIECGPAPAGVSMQDQVVTEVSVFVTDPDRDLISVSATLNGIPIEVTDDDATMWFSWQPDPQDTPLRCQGSFSLNVIARDAEGHETTSVIIIEK